MHGTVEMSTLSLDPNTFLYDNLTEASVADPVMGAARVGHIHLQVGDVDTAREFYVERLGFAQTAMLGPQSLFVSAGGYHHHMAMNTWNSGGAGPRLPALGLAQVRIEVPAADDLGALAERVTHFGIKRRDDGSSVSFDDPWGSQITVGVKADRQR